MIPSTPQHGGQSHDTHQKRAGFKAPVYSVPVEKVPLVIIPAKAGIQTSNVLSITSLVVENVCQRMKPAKTGLFQQVLTNIRRLKQVIKG